MDISFLWVALTLFLNTRLCRRHNYRNKRTLKSNLRLHTCFGGCMFWTQIYTHICYHSKEKCFDSDERHQVSESVYHPVSILGLNRLAALCGLSVSCFGGGTLSWRAWWLHDIHTCTHPHTFVHTGPQLSTGDFSSHTGLKFWAQTALLRLNPLLFSHCSVIKGIQYLCLWTGCGFLRVHLSLLLSRLLPRSALLLPLSLSLCPPSVSL